MRFFLNLATYIGYLSLSLFTSQTVYAQATNSHSPELQRYALCAALSSNTQKNEFSQALIQVLQTAKIAPNSAQAKQQAEQRIQVLEQTFSVYPLTSKQKLFNRLCLDLQKPIDQNFAGLKIEEMPVAIQEKISLIAECALLSERNDLAAQAKQLTAANALIVIAAGINGKNQALIELKQVHQSLNETFGKLTPEQLQQRFTRSCNEVQALQNKQKPKE
ncbi:MAG: hypothetical protein JXR44_01420 [Thiotrichales bacterium]|nr:hypothetical protein [Thiotrichales bacterium]